MCLPSCRRDAGYCIAKYECQCLPDFSGPACETRKNSGKLRIKFVLIFHVTLHGKQELKCSVISILSEILYWNHWLEKNAIIMWMFCCTKFWYGTKNLIIFLMSNSTEIECVNLRFYLEVDNSDTILICLAHKWLCYLEPCMIKLSNPVLCLYAQPLHYGTMRSH